MVRRRPWGACLVVLALLGLSPAPSIASTASAEDGDPTGGVQPPLRVLADRAGLRLGATLEPDQAVDPPYAEVLRREFNALTAENAMKWYSIQPERGLFDFSGADAVLAFAEDHGMAVRGHNLVWSQDQYTPAWVRAISDRAELRTVLHDHIEAVLDRYRGRIHRWDVVNEPLETLGTGPADTVFGRVLGPGWLAEALRHAHQVDPTIEIWLNEFGSDWVAGKHEAFLALVSGLLRAGVPLDGVGLQTHRVSVDGPERATFQRQLEAFADLGLRVALTEVDVATRPDDPLALDRQAEAYETIVRSCLAVAACEEVTLWGVTDRDTWLDALPLFEAPTRPLLFDDEFAPKPAYDAVARALADGRDQPPLRASTPPPVSLEPAFTG